MYIVYVYFRKCLKRYNAALSIVDTDEMWDKFLTTLIKIISDAERMELCKIYLIKEIIHGAHKKNKLKPNHYIQLVRDLNCVFRLHF